MAVLLRICLARSPTLGLVDYMCRVHGKASKPRLRRADLTAQSCPSLSSTRRPWGPHSPRMPSARLQISGALQSPRRSYHDYICQLASAFAGPPGSYSKPSAHGVVHSNWSEDFFILRIRLHIVFYLENKYRWSFCFAHCDQTPTHCTVWHTLGSCTITCLHKSTYTHGHICPHTHIHSHKHTTYSQFQGGELRTQRQGVPCRVEHIQLAPGGSSPSPIGIASHFNIAQRCAANAPLTHQRAAANPHSSAEPRSYVTAVPG